MNDSLSTSPSEAPEEKIRQRTAGAEQVYKRMEEKAKTDEKMAELLYSEDKQEFQTSLEQVVEKTIASHDSELQKTAEKLQHIEKARLTLFPDGRMQVEASVARIAEIVEATKERQRRA